ncbi:ATP-dependent exoDNAse (exonuclease V), alpha subunit, helicase superfamily I [Streptomyces sp. Ag82_O1-12]|uniref:helix-hairpin-helix domain-containing protein n=1 Tax=unclassified Streptomyces TaxID=2593676 RepID=UPI000BDC66FC|nr:MULTISPECIES: helix-hairpin-helix domain-containing protein [unclassified Streptomyces]SMQ15195.1 ATP-dependent exoDNAse (exonuclease V), alpha subunit, helicase superfamily I [Streptomyces sp. Ag82_O1-12]SOD44223.1 ATP-dependent exoDNAse (exonuclease V), alpha subunit, helicase superfamily I [Streptomyces sp. Ag82_G6-1]
MSTEPETTEDTEPGTPGTGQVPDTVGGGAGAGQAPGPGAEDGGQGPEAEAADADAGQVSQAEGTEAGVARKSEAETADSDAGETSGAEGTEAGVGQVSEAEAELRAQQAERERIEQRKAEKKAPIESGTKLSGKAADLLAAVRAVESGEKPVAAVFEESRPAPRRSAPEPERRPQPVAPPPAATSAAPAPEAVQAVRRVLAEGGAPEVLAPQVAAALGEGADDQLRADPWQLLRTAGVRPEQADGFARSLLGAECGPDDERRGRAVTGWLLEQAALAGHTALEMPALLAALAQRGVPEPESAVQDAIAEGDALVFQDALEEAGTPAPTAAEGDEEDAERPVRVLVGLERYALAEESLADGLGRLVNSVPKQDGSAEDWERAAAAAQGSTAELIRAVAGQGLVLHTGGEASLAEPAALLNAARTLGLRAWAAAHGPIGRSRFAALLRRSGQAADVPERAGGPPAGPGDSPVATVSGLLAGAEGPGRDADGALDLDLLVVLDAPQLDVETAALLTESLPDGARLVLAGDPAVLWSVGPGRVFADLLAARICPQVASRRPDPGPLGELVSGIGIGELNQVEAPGKEVVIVPVRDAGEAVHRTVQLVADSVPRAIGVPAEETQVITPGHGGAVGTRALNAALKERLNPGPGRFGGFDPGDRIVYSPTPGRALPGRVVTADAEGLHLSCEGETVVVPKERVEQSVRHGWALTAHQAVGSRWPAVVVVLPGDAAQALSRPWVYTAFGRADRHLSVVHGVEQALPRAVAEVPAKPRTTRLPVLLAPQISGT